MTDLAPDSDGSVAEAGDRLAKLFAGDTSPSVTPTKPRDETGRFVSAKPKVKPEDAEPDSQEPAAEPSEAASDEETPAEDAPTEEPAEEEPEEQDDTPLPKTIKVKVDGIEQELPLDEVAKGYSRTADYTRKTQALAEERKRFEAEEVAPVRQERQLYAERLAQLEDLVKSQMPDREPDWAVLRNQLSPEEFTQAFADWRVQAQRMEKVRAERDRVAQLQQADEGKVRQARLAAEWTKLQDALPDLKDPEKGKALIGDLKAYAHSIGIPEDGLDAVEDHQLIVVLNKARLYDQAALRKPKISEKIDRVLESAKPNNAKPRPKMSEIERSMAQVRKTGSVDDAAVALNHLFARQ